jgi:hypothetical protein
MEMLGWKIKTAILWVCFSIVQLFANIMLKSLEIPIPDYFKTLSIAPDIFWILFPLLMVILTLFLKDTAGRWTNIIVGIIFILSNIAYLIFFIISKSISLVIIVLLGLALLVLITVSSFNKVEKA